MIEGRRARAEHPRRASHARRLDFWGIPSWLNSTNVLIRARFRRTIRLAGSPLYRRRFLQQASLGFGTMALAYLLDQEQSRAAGDSREAPGGLDLRPRRGHFPAQASAVIMLMQAGGPSQIDLFDPKPELKRRNGEEYAGNVEVLQPGSETKKLMASPFRFRSHGQCGMELSELIPWIGGVADDLCLVRSMTSDNNNHPQATRCLLSGKDLPGPSVARLVDQLCAGNREPELAGVRRPARPRRLQQRRHDDVGERVAAGHLPGDRDPVARGRGARPSALGRRCPTASSETTSRRWPASTKNGAGSTLMNRTSMRASAIMSWRRGCSEVPQEVLRIDGETAADAAALRPRRPGHRELRDTVLDGPAACRIGRPVRPGDGAGEVRR